MSTDMSINYFSNIAKLLFPIWDFCAGYFGNIIKWDFGFDYGDVSVSGVYAGDHARYGVIGIGLVKSHRYHHAFFNQRELNTRIKVE